MILWLGFGLALWMGYQAWVLDYSIDEPAKTTETAAVSPSSSMDDSLPDLAAPVETANGGSDGVALPALSGSAQAVAAPASEQRYVQVTTDVLSVSIDLNGGNLVGVDLLSYPIAKDEPDTPVTLLSSNPGARFVLNSGLRTRAGVGEPNHLAEFDAAGSEFALSGGQDELVVTLQWRGSAVVKAEKQFVFHRGSYHIEQRLIVDNGSAEIYSAAAYSQLIRTHVPVERSFTSVDSYSYTGPVYYDGEKYQKLDFEDLAEEPLKGDYTNGWVASIQHHFLAAAVPPADQVTAYQGTVKGDQYTLTAVGPLMDVAPGERKNFDISMFVGPKLQAQLTPVAKGLELTVDYGFLTILSQPLFWILSKIHDFVGNWGWSIIIVTALIKLVFYKLTETSGRSMAKMRKLQPRMKAMQDRFKDDRQALSQAMMEMYKREKVNPAAGCLPILIQMPFFFAFYWVLIESVEMRQAVFALWINDLSSKDPFFVLPLLMGAAMLYQTRLNPAPPDPIQAKVMQIMPVVFTVFFAFFPAGLVLYWLTNTLLSIAQQWNINRRIEAEG
jgi:YidC/Oxa1 family membrane protein insertase